MDNNLTDEYLKRDDWYYYIPFNFIGLDDDNPYISNSEE